EGVLEAEEVEEVESAGSVAVGVAGGAAGADGEAAGGHAANAVEAAADPEIAIDHFEAEDAAVRAAADDFPCAAGELQRAAGAGLADDDGGAGSIIEDGAGGDAPAEDRADGGPLVSIPLRDVGRGLAGGRELEAGDVERIAAAVVVDEH